MPYSKRKKYSPQFKFKLSLEAIKTDNLSEIARQHSIGANILSRWKQQLLEGGYQIFDTAPNKLITDQEKKIAKLEQIIGKKEVELNLVKNFSEFYESRNSP